MIDIQVWDVAGTMTFYMLLSVLPAAIAMISVVSMLGFQERTVDTLGSLVTEVFPSVDAEPYERTLLALGTTRGGVLGLTLGTFGALLSASNGMAAFHRALHHVYDTREGRPFLWFRTIVFGETVLAVAMVMLIAGVVVVGGEATQEVGEFVGIPRFAFQVWNVVKWPILLGILIVAISLAYYLFPNVRLPRYRVMTVGSTLVVLLLFGAAQLLGRLTGELTRISDLLPALNGAIGILLLLWLANIVIVAGAALDAELLRARQIAAGLPAWHHLALETHASHSLEFLAGVADHNEEVGRAVCEAARTEQPLTHGRSASIVDAGSLFAINPPRRRAVHTGPEQPVPVISRPTALAPSPSREPATPGASDIPAATMSSADPAPSSAASPAAANASASSPSAASSSASSPPAAPSRPSPSRDTPGEQQ
ncbi:YihY/virulence factor BrkB family protein [Brachybacterium endophyticum]|uniref:YihY/virulence factor BrkB family protein n=2 Tax=Brachybacterium endophyticum TaxID=2182385 RepID=A0A2U2RMF8_9MICO|nr:YihY/virulence factor BrkB family protein [Brachybacterium endophyticum]